MISNKFMMQVRISGVILGLLPQPAVQADNDQLQSALIQTEASLKSLEKGDTQGAAAHAEAARSHVEIAAREVSGQTLRDISACHKQLKEAEQRLKNDQKEKAKVVASQARDLLKGWVGS